MATIEITQGTLVVHIEGADRLWTLRSRLEVPLEHIVGVGPSSERIKAFMGFRRFGTHVPGVIAAGTFYQDGRTVFWDVHHPDRAVEIELRDERFAKLVVEVAEPQTTIDEVMSALSLHALSHHG